MTDEEIKRLEEIREYYRQEPGWPDYEFLLSIIDTTTAELKYAKQEVKVLNDELFLLKKAIEELRGTK